MINRYSNIGILKSSTGNRYYKTNYYPDIPLASNDIYVITTEGDRYDILAQQYYSDSSLWWVIIRLLSSINLSKAPLFQFQSSIITMVSFEKIGSMFVNATY